MVSSGELSRLSCKLDANWPASWVLGTELTQLISSDSYCTIATKLERVTEPDGMFQLIFMVKKL